MPSQPSPNPRHKWSPRRQTDIVCATPTTHDLPCKSPKWVAIPNASRRKGNHESVVKTLQDMCDESVTRNVLRHSTWQVQRRLWVAAHSRWVFSSPKSVSLMAQALLAPQSTSLVWHRLNDCRRADCQTIKRIAFHRKVTNFGLHATACNSGVPSSWHRSALQNDSHLSPTCQTLPTSQSFGR